MADRRLRGLEADLRVANKNLQKSDDKLQETKEKLSEVNDTLTDVQETLKDRTRELEETKQLLRAECEKTQSLREDLTGRAEETIRAEVHARQMETELSVLKAGASAIHEEVDRLSAERNELTGRLQELEDELLPAEALEEDPSKKEQPKKKQPKLDEPLIDF